MHARARHPLAGFRTAAALLGAPTHDFVVAHALAGLGTRSTDLGAGLARARVKMGAAEHVIGAGGADLRTVQKERNVLWLSVLASLLEAVRDGRRADAVTTYALINALLHIGARRASLNSMWHDTSPVSVTGWSGGTLSRRRRAALYVP